MIAALVLAPVARSGLAQTAQHSSGSCVDQLGDVDSLGPGRHHAQCGEPPPPEIAVPVRLEAVRQRAGTRQPETEDVACPMSEAQE